VIIWLKRFSLIDNLAFNLGMPVERIAVKGFAAAAFMDYLKTLT
jgi:hypothetical protein